MFEMIEEIRIMIMIKATALTLGLEVLDAAAAVLLGEVVMEGGVDEVCIDTTARYDNVYARSLWNGRRWHDGRCIWSVSLILL